MLLVRPEFSKGYSVKYISVMTTRTRRSVPLPKWIVKFFKVEIWMSKFQAVDLGLMPKMARTRQSYTSPEWGTTATLRAWKICSLSMLKLSMSTPCKTRIFALFMLTRNQELFPTFRSTGFIDLKSLEKIWSRILYDKTLWAHFRQGKAKDWVRLLVKKAHLWQTLSKSSFSIDFWDFVWREIFR